MSVLLRALSFCVLIKALHPLPQALGKILVDFPVRCPSLPEQKKISDSFSALDAQIANEQAILDDWKLLKKGLLQQMFV